MSVENSVKVIKYAARHPSFRASYRNSPREALKEYKNELCLDSDGLSIEEMDNVLSFSDDDYASFEKLVEKVQPDVSPDDRTSILI